MLCVSGAKYRYSREIGDERIEPDAFTYYLDKEDTVDLNYTLQIYAGKERSFVHLAAFLKTLFANNFLATILYIANMEITVMIG